MSKSKPTRPLNLEGAEPGPVEGAVVRPRRPGHHTQAHVGAPNGLSWCVNLGLIEAGKSGQGGRIDDQF
jgi:hypothetical protein